MEPMKPERRRELLASNPQITEADIDELERLTGLMFEREPADDSPPDTADERRRQELIQKIYGKQGRTS